MATPKWTLKYWIPWYQDAGYSDLFASLGPQGLGQQELIADVNAVGSLPDMNWEMITEYIADVQNAGDLAGYVMTGVVLPPPTTRNVAPSGLGQDATSIFFSTPDAGIATVAWFVNGALIVQEPRDLSTDRSILKSQLGCAVNDIVQICIVDGDVYGWWSRIKVE